MLGASYGSLFATKLLLAGHSVTLVCRKDEAELLNQRGTRVRFPVRELSETVEVASRALPGRLAARTPGAVDPLGFDLVVLAMQEPQYSADDLRSLLAAIAEAKRPCLSLMNMPTPPFMARFPGVDVGALASCYAAPDIWDEFEPALMTACSPDPQAVRPQNAASNTLEVRLPTNFRAARFARDTHNEMLLTLEHDILAARFAKGTTELKLPVQLRVYDSVFAPISKWPMLMTGNYRCLTANGIRSIKDMVHGNAMHSRIVYESVADICKLLGADPGELVPFEKYARAAAALTAPSSVARALLAGADRVERVDRLVQAIAAQRGRRVEVVDEIVAIVDRQLEANRCASAAPSAAAH